MLYLKFPIGILKGVNFVIICILPNVIFKKILFSVFRSILAEQDWFTNLGKLESVMGIRCFQENGSLSISPEDFNFYKKKLSVLKISKPFVFFLRTSGEYLTRFG